MKRINNIGWMVLAVVSFFTGTWVWASEGTAHSKFYMFYLLTAVCLLFVFLGRKGGAKSGLPKKRR